MKRSRNVAAPLLAVAALGASPITASASSCADKPIRAFAVVFQDTSIQKDVERGGFGKTFQDNAIAIIIAGVVIAFLAKSAGG